MPGKQTKRYIISIAAIVFATIAIIGVLLLIDHQYFTRDDNASYFFPSYVYDWRSVVEQHTIPLINFYQYLGHPYLATGQSAVLYPPVYIAAALSYFFTHTIDATVTIAVVMHLLVGALGMFCLLRQKKISFTVATLMSVAYISLPIVTYLSRSWISAAYTAAYLPWVFFCLHRLVTRPRLSSGVALAIVHTLFLLQGNIQFVLMGGFFELVFVALFLKPKSGADRMRGVVAFVLSCTLTILLSLPLLLPMFNLFQVSLREVEASTWIESLNAVFPLLINMLLAQVCMGPNLWHIGIPLLAFLIVLSQKNTRSWLTDKPFQIYGVLAIIAFLFSDLLAPLTHFLPVLGYFRWPWKYYLFFGFFLIPVLAQIVHVVIIRIPKQKWTFIGLIALGIALNVIRDLPARQYEPLTTVVVEHPSEVLVEAVHPDAGRVFSFWLDEPTDEHAGRLYAFNFPTLDQVYAFTGYEPLVTQFAAELTLSSTYETLSVEDHERLNAWSVRYFVIQDIPNLRMRIEALPDVHLLASEGGVLLYENTQALPFAYVVNNSQEALPTVFGVNDVTITTNALLDEDVILTLAPQKGYQLFFDGVYAEDLDPNGEEPLRFAVPAGVHEVVVRYTDKAFTFGLLISLMSLVMLCAVFLWAAWKRLFAF